MLENDLGDEEALELYERGREWTPDKFGGYRCEIKARPFVMIQLNLQHSNSVFKIFFDSKVIYENDGKLAQTLMEEVDKMYGGTLVDIEAQKRSEGIAYIRKLLTESHPVENQDHPETTNSS